MIGSLIGNYRVVSELGQGGMGTVYFAEHPLIGRRAAIKVLHPEISANADVVSRFFTEARAVNAIGHPNIVQVTDFGQLDERYYFVMELLEGETLGERLERVGCCEQGSAIRITAQVASAVGAAHEQGIVHRDLKPENIFITNHRDYPDYVKVLDFGIAKLLAGGERVKHRTQSGTLMGTPAYMSPEQCVGEVTLDHRSDIYSLGVVLYEMVTGQTPFEGDTVGKLIVAHVNQAPRPPVERNPQISPALNAIILRTLAKKPEQRFASMEEMRRALGEVEGARRTSGHRAPASAERIAERAPEQVAAKGAPAAPPARGVEGGRIIGQALNDIVQERIQSDRLVLPAMPAIALKCMELLRNPEQSFRLLVDTIKQDPLLAPRVLRVANSAAFQGRERVVKLDQALGRLGTEELRSVLVEFAARQVFDSHDERIGRAFHGIWEHALAVAIMARDLAAHFGRVDAEEVYLAGLLHDVGKPVMGALLLEAEKVLREKQSGGWIDDVLWLEAVNRHHRAVGVALARKWQLPEAISHAIEDCGEYDPQDQHCVANYVRYANALAKHQGIGTGEIDRVAVEELLDMGSVLLGVDEKLAARVTEGIRDRVSALTGTRSARRRTSPNLKRTSSRK